VSRVRELISTLVSEPPQKSAPGAGARRIIF
jgi:hypothetical protein